MFTNVFDVVKTTLLIPTSFAVVYVSKKIYRGLRFGYYRSKETVSNLAFAQRGQDVSFSHYTSKDLANYKSWVLNREQDILDIISATELPKYLTLKTNDSLYPTCSNFVQKDSSYLQKHLDRDYRNEVALIESYISDYVKASDEPFVGSIKKRKWWASRFHSRDKMSPQKMVIKLVRDFIEKDLINYSDKEHELAKLKLLRDYLSKLRQDINVSSDTNFHIFLNKTTNQIEEIETRIQNKLNIDSFKIKLNKAYNSTRNTVQDLMRTIYNLFNFNDRQYGLETDIAELVTKSQTHKVNTWLHELNNMLVNGVNDSDLEPEKYIKRIEPLIQIELNDLEKTESYPKQHPVLDISDYKLLASLQRESLELVNILVMLDYYKKSNSDTESLMYKITLVEIKHITSILHAKMESLSNSLKQIEPINQKLQRYMLSLGQEDYRRTAEVKDKIDSLKLSIQTTLGYINDAHSSLKVNDEYRATEASPVSKLISLIGNQELIFNLSATVLDAKIIKFINSLKEDGKFNDPIKKVLVKYFEIETDSDNNEVIRKIILEKLRPIEDNTFSNYSQYLMLLQIFSELLIGFDDYKEASELIDKFTEFLIGQFLNSSNANIATMIRFFSKALIRHSKDARENQGLRDIIEQHLASFEAYVISFVNDASNELNIQQAGEKTTSEKLQTFISSLIEKINAQSEETHKLISRYNELLIGDASNERKDLIHRFSEQLSDSTKLNKVSLKSLELVTNLIHSAVVLKESYQSTTTNPRPSIFNFQKEELEDMTKTIQEGIKTQQQCINKLNIKIVNIEKSQKRTFNTIINDIKDKLGSFKQEILGSSNYKLYFNNICKYLGSTSVSVELAIISALESVCSGQESQEQKLIKIVSLLKYASSGNKKSSNKFILSSEFLSFVTSTLSLINRYFNSRVGKTSLLKIDDVFSKSGTKRLL